MCKIDRRAIRIKGIVQGVGFRPFIFNLAREHGLVGWVTNDSSGVFIEIEGSKEQVCNFITEIPSKVPPLARIDSIETDYREPLGEKEFLIRPSNRSEKGQTLISPDMGTCPDCLRELFDPADRRYLYPFINCTNCGPRFTIIQEMPYDRPYTTMGDFVMCSTCEQEYQDPRDRMFHAQPNACSECGPRVWLTDNQGMVFDIKGICQGLQEWAEVSATFSEELCTVGTSTIPYWARDIIWLRRELVNGKIVGVKGLGGYHLVCDAMNEMAVQTLRQRKARPDKPLAVMMASVEQVKHFCHLSAEEENLLTSSSRPIVLLSWKGKGVDGIAPGIADAQSRLGVMLPYTPLHHMLFDEHLQVLVMTSGNISGEPIIYNDEEAVARLGKVVDYFLVHNREIVRPCDDSVQRVDDKPIMLRRSRGYAPMPVRGGWGQRGWPRILACGGELKNTFALLRGDQVFLSQHIGDLKTRNSFLHYRLMIEEMIKLLEIEPEVVAYDLHPGYISSKYALERFSEKRMIGVQHHHAHLASCMAENGLEGSVIGLAFDGTGYGIDGKIWGGEIMITSPEKFERWAHLKYLPLPGGDQAVLEPWRIGAAYLNIALAGVEWMSSVPFWRSIDESQWELLKKFMAKGLQTPESSSMGRLFDGVGAIMGLRKKISYEGQVAIELEELAGGVVGKPYPYLIEGTEPPFELNPLPMIRAIGEALVAGVELSSIAQRFHGTLVDMSRNICEEIRSHTGISRVVLSGGVFQNRLLSRAVKVSLEEKGFGVYQQSQVPANDGGLALGQIYVASHTLTALR